MFRILAFLLLSNCSPLVAQPLVVVSVAPQKYVVERVAGNKVAVDVLVPAGASPHFYEPSAKQVIAASKGVAWFRIGEGFEQQALAHLSKRMVVINQNKGCDPHIWLSPRLLKAQAQEIAETLTSLFPEEKEVFEDNLSLFTKELEILDREIISKIQSSSSKTILVSHAAFGHFCSEYGLKQLSIEYEGKEPSARKVTQLLVKARAAKVNCVYIQPQYNTKGAKQVANALGVNVALLDPYKENVVENLYTIAHCFANQ